MSKSGSPFLVLCGAASLFTAPLVLPALFQASAAALTAADTDKDGDGTVDAKELHTKAGIKLDRVIE